MKQSQKAQKLIGKFGFESYYSEIFKDEWNELELAIQKENVYLKFQFEDFSPYFLDPASVCAALTLPLKNEQISDSSANKILDMCAAPGGKTLVLSSNLQENQSLFSNERSSSRKARLEKVCESSVPQKILEKIKITCSDSATWCRKETEAYSSILLDAPCSSERHVFSDSKYLNEWTPSRIKSLCVEQWALISSAWRLLVPGGFLLYSTCALSPGENDEIIARLLKKFDGVKVFSFSECKAFFEENLNSSKAVFSFPESDFEKFESQNCQKNFLQGISSAQNFLKKIYSSSVKTSLGFHILPHKAFGCGPIFFTLLQKTKSLNL